MEIIPLATAVLNPPQDDLFAAIRTADPSLCDGDVVVVSSKVVAIHEGNCVPVRAVDKLALIEQEADVVIPRTYWNSPLTIVHSAFISAAGIDVSNADGHYVLLPRDPFASARRLHEFLCNEYSVTKLGVVISDSHSVPLRRGAVGVSVGFWGFEPTINHAGEYDLFGREMKVAVSNVVDGIAAAANIVMGETSESKPVAIVRDVPGLTFTDESCQTGVYLTPEEDTYRVLYQDFLL